MDTIRIGYVQVHAVETAASVHVGPHLMVGSHSVLKSMMANGQINGNVAAMPTVVSWISDPDIVDNAAHHTHGIWVC